MAYGRTKALLIVAIVFSCLCFSITVAAFDRMPPLVRFTIPIQPKYNATDFTYSLTYSSLQGVDIDKTYLNESNDSFLTSTHYAFKNDSAYIANYNTIRGIARVGAEIHVRITYYTTADSLEPLGLNTVTKPDPNEVGLDYIKTIVTETDDNVVGQYDGGFWFAIFIGALILMILCVATVCSYYVEKDGGSSN